MKKRVISLFLLLAMSLSLLLSLPAQAAVITPQWSGSAQASATLHFSGDTALCSVTVIGGTGTSAITTVVTLDEWNPAGYYETSATWGPTTAYSTRYSSTYSAYNRSSGTYRLTVSATVYYSDGSSEHVSTQRTVTH